MTDHACRLVLKYAPPEIVASYEPSRCDNSYNMNTAVEVFVFGLILAEVAGASRLYPKNHPGYARQLTQMSYDSWVQVRCLLVTTAAFFVIPTWAAQMRQGLYTQKRTKV